MEGIEFKFYDEWTELLHFCGMDVHKYEIAVAICSAGAFSSKIVKTTIFSADADGLDQFWNFVKKYRPHGFVMEATGIYHHLPFKFLMEKKEKACWNYDIVVVNPSDAAGLPGRQKNDKIDAEHLAVYLSKGLLKDGKPIIQAIEYLKMIFRMANQIEKNCTALKNRIKKTLDRAGIRPRRFILDTLWARHFLYHFIEHEGSLGTFLKEAITEDHALQKHRNTIVKNLSMFEPYLEYSLSSVQRAIIRHNLVELDFKTSSKTLLTVEIEQILVKYPTLRRDAYNLASIPGISPFTAVWILAEITNIKQFKNRRHFASYCGCCPRIVSSAGKIYSAHTNRHSNKYLRTIFYQAATVLCYFTRKSSVLKEYAEHILQRKGHTSSKLALCIIAAKINKIAFAVLRDKRPFYPELIHVCSNETDSENEAKLSVLERRLLRNARNSLIRVRNMENSKKLGLLGDNAINLAKELDEILSGKNF